MGILLFHILQNGWKGHSDIFFGVSPSLLSLFLDIFGELIHSNLIVIIQVRLCYMIKWWKFICVQICMIKQIQRRPQGEKSSICQLHFLLPVFFLLLKKRSLLQPPPLLPLSLHVKVSRSPHIYPSQFWNPIFLHLGLRKQLFVFFNYWERSFSSPTTPQDSIGGTPQYTWRRA